MEIRLRDGRQDLLTSSESYDVITLEPPPPSSIGIVNLYSRDFYRIAAARLQQDGILAQWLPLATQNDRDTRSLVRSFLDEFPYSTLWTTEFHETLLLGSLSPIEIDTSQISARYRQQGVEEALREMGIVSPAALLATFVTGRDGLEHYTNDAEAVTYDRPRIEYGPWVLSGDFERTFSHVMDLRSYPPLKGADLALTAEVANQREILLGFYAAALDAYRGDRGNWRQTMEWVLDRDPENPYYNWFTMEGGSH